jgi:hypothetical protein
MEYILFLAKILIIQFLVFTLMNAWLKTCLLDGTGNSWVFANASIALVLQILYNFFDQSPTFAFVAAVSLYIMQQGFSANYKNSDEIHLQVESLQKKASRLSLVASAIGYVVAFAKVA